MMRERPITTIQHTHNTNQYIPVAHSQFTLHPSHFGSCALLSLYRCDALAHSAGPRRALSRFCSLVRCSPASFRHFVRLLSASFPSLSLIPLCLPIPTPSPLAARSLRSNACRHPEYPEYVWEKLFGVCAMCANAKHTTHKSKKKNRKQKTEKKMWKEGISLPC